MRHFFVLVAAICLSSTIVVSARSAFDDVKEITPGTLPSIEPGTDCFVYESIYWPECINVPAECEETEGYCECEGYQMESINGLSLWFPIVKYYCPGDARGVKNITAPPEKLCSKRVASGGNKFASADPFKCYTVTGCNQEATPTNINDSSCDWPVILEFPEGSGNLHFFSTLYGRKSACTGDVGSIASFPPAGTKIPLTCYGAACPVIPIGGSGGNTGGTGGTPVVVPAGE